MFSYGICFAPVIGCVISFFVCCKVLHVLKFLENQALCLEMTYQWQVGLGDIAYLLENY